VQVKSSGALAPIRQRSRAFPPGLLPTGDSLVIAEYGKGGGVSFGVVPANGSGDGQMLLKPGETIGGVSADWSQLLYLIPNGATRELGLLNRTDGTTGRLTTNSVDEAGPAITPNGNTVVFQRLCHVR
jgi:hypothetical protein